MARVKNKNLDHGMNETKKSQPRDINNAAGAQGRLARWLPRLPALPFILGFATILTGLIGWTLKLFDGTFHSIVSIILKLLVEFIPNEKNLDGETLFTDLSALFGVLTFYSSVLLIGFAALRETGLKLWVRTVCLNHVVVIGATPLAHRIATAFQGRGKNVIQVVPPDVSPAAIDSTFCIGHRTEAVSLIATFGLRRADCIVIDQGDDVATLGLAHGLVTELREGSSLKRNISSTRILALAISDATLADHFSSSIKKNSHVDKDFQLSFFDEALTSVRDCLARHPLYLLAEERDQPRVHVLIEGFGSLGKKLLEEIMMTQIAGNLGAPRVTVMTPRAKTSEIHFRAARPGLGKDAPITFLNADVLDRLDDPECEDATALARLEAQDPVTAIFLTSSDNGAVVRTGLMIRAIQRRTRRLSGAIFFPQPQTGPKADVLSISPHEPEIAGKFIRFGVSDEMLIQQVSDLHGRDALVRALHEAYLAGDRVSSAAGKPWHFLPETMRRANYQAADHFRAKLHTLGFGIRELPLDVIPALSAEDEIWLFHTAEADALLGKLARVEHERWCIERQLDGWVYDEKRDDERRRHNLLLPWQILVENHPEEAEKDRAQVEALLRFLIAHGDQRHAAVRRDGITG